MDLIAVISIIAVAIAIDRWFARQAKGWVKLIEQIEEEQKVKEEKLRKHLERIEEEQKREKLFEMHPLTEKIIEKYLEEHSEGGTPVEKKVLEQYIDACELIKETEKDIRRLKKKRQTIVQTNVSGSNPDFPYNPQHFKIAGTAFTYEEDARLRHEEKILEERRENAQRLKVEVEQWMNHIPQRMQRIIKYKVFEGLSWSQVASKLGRKATEGSVKMEFQRFFEKE